MGNDKVKVYKNPKRAEVVAPAKYVPQYQVLGVDPQEYKSSVVPNNTVVLQQPSPDNPRTRTTSHQPYAEVPHPTFPVGRGPAPNVGNNMEHTWSSVDGQIIDDISTEYPTEPDHAMIDNNEYVDPKAFNLSSSSSSLPEYEDVNEDELAPILNDLDAGSYLLLVKGVPICSGPAEEIEDQVKALIFGEHELSGGVSIPEEDLIVLKKVSIKVGVFLE